MRQMFAIVLGGGLLLSICCPHACRAGEDVVLKDQTAKDSYSLGYEFGEKVRGGNIDIERELLFLGIGDALDGKKPVLSPEELRQTLQDLRKKVVILLDKRSRELAAKSLEDGQAFLAANKTNKGVVALPSGLQYKVLQEGKEGPSPKLNESVTVQYRGTLIDGTEFDSSLRRGEPTTLNVNGVIPGWTEALQRMKVGSKWQIFVPAGLAYGERRFGRIPPNSALIFELELVSIGDPAGSNANAPKPSTNALPAGEFPDEDNGDDNG